MPVDKFGRHLHQHSGDHSKVYVVEDAAQLVAALKEDIMTAVRKLTNRNTMFYILALSADKDGQYRLVNSTESNGKFEYTYSLPTAFVSKMQWSPPEAKLYINGVEKSKEDLIGTTLSEGSKITATHKKNSRQLFVCEFVMQYPTYDN